MNRKRRKDYYREALVPDTPRSVLCIAKERWDRHWLIQHLPGAISLTTPQSSNTCRSSSCVHETGCAVTILRMRYKRAVVAQPTRSIDRQSRTVSLCLTSPGIPPFNTATCVSLWRFGLRFFRSQSWPTLAKTGLTKVMTIITFPVETGGTKATISKPELTPAPSPVSSTQKCPM